MEPGRFEVHDGEVPEVGPEEVRLKVKAAGICGTDLEVYRGHVPSGWSIEFPFQMGHELSGIVDAVGSAVPNVKVGDRVVPDGRIPCGYCSFCRQGAVNACINGGYTSGGFREYSVYGYRALVPVPEKVSFEEAAMAEPVSCTMYGNAKLDVEVGSLAVVIGEGAIGLLHAQLLKNRGAETVVVGLIEERLKTAEKMGADHIINAGKSDPVAEIDRISGGRGADVVVVAAGVEIVLQQALKMAGRFGQVLYFAANMKETCVMPMDLIHYKELKVIGSYDSTTAWFEKALHAMDVGKIDARALISDTFPLEEIGKAFKWADEGKGMKIMIINEEKN
jgi:L-iditol 2-dehydrogenase